MKKISLLSSVIILIVLMTSCSKENFTDPSENFSATQNTIALKEAAVNNYIVVFSDEYTPESKFAPGMSYDKRNDVMGSFVREYFAGQGIAGVNPVRYYNKALHGFAASLSLDVVEKLRNDSRIKFVEQDQVVSINGKPGGGGGTPPAQVTPWGITRVGGSQNFSNSAESNKVWILDTGIDFTHTDLNVDVTNAKTFLTTGKDARSASDNNGHGSHVAGIIGAKNNTIGVVGVAAGVLVVPIKVLDLNGNGTVSSVINGIDWVANHGKAGDVANMSLSGGVSATLDQAVVNASANGIWFVLAAGNSAANANNYSPARANGTYIVTVSAMDNADYFASFSNYANPPVDYCAPGVSVYSTYKGGGYATMSGTSMAAPHVAGLLVSTGGTLNFDGYVAGDKDATADAIAHR